MVFYVTGERGTIRGPSRCNTTDACLKLYQGMKGVGTDEAAVTAVVSSHTAKQRQQICKKYHQVYKKDLIKELDGELSFAFGKLVHALMMDPEEFILESIRNAVVPQRRGGNIVKRLSAIFKDGLSKTEYSILSLLCPRSNQELEEIKRRFKDMFEMDMEEKIALGGNDLPQDLCTLLLDMLSGERKELGEGEEIDYDLVEEDIDNLLEKGGCEEAFQEMMQERSFQHLRAVFDMYAEETGMDIQVFVEERGGFSAELKEAYKGILLLLTNPAEFYACRLKEAIEGAGTDDETLIRIVVLRSEVDMLDIIDVYETKFGKSLEEDVAGDTSGDYKDILLKILEVPEDEKKRKKEMRRRGAGSIKGGRKSVRRGEVEPEPEVVTRRRAGKVQQQQPPQQKRQGRGKKIIEVEESAEEEEEEEEVIIVKKVKKVKATPKKKKVPVEEEEEVEEVEEEPKKVTKKSAAAKSKKAGVKKVKRPPTPEEEEEEEEDDQEKSEEEEEEEEEEVVEVKPKKKAVKTTKAAPKKKRAPTPEEEEEEEDAEEEQPQQTEVEDAEEDEEVVQVKKKKKNKQVTKVKNTMKACSRNKTAAAVDDDGNLEEDGEDKDNLKEIEEETDAVVITVEEPDDNDDATGSTSNKANEADKVDEECSPSPIISREL